MSAAGGSGSRARSRELGYAEAMRDISSLISDRASRWKSTGEQQLDPTAHVITLALADQLRKLADYAHSVSMLYEIPDMDDLTGFAWKPWPGESVPAELPQREHPESN